MGGYQMPFDPRPLIQRLESTPEDVKVWDELIEELYHQRDVGDASYAAVCLLVRSEAIAKVLPWQLLALVAFIELARTAPRNPSVPSWLISDYLAGIETLASLSLKALEAAETPEQLQGLLSIVALQKGLRVYASALCGYSEDELKELLPE